MNLLILAESGLTKFAVFGVPAIVVFFVVIMIVKQYKRCPSNCILVVYGKVAGGRAAKCMHGGGVFVVPLLQDYSFLNLEPMTIDIDLAGALSKKNIRVNVPSTFTVGISTNPKVMVSASERLLFLDEKKIKTQAQDIILGQLRLVIATLSIEEINQDREKFLELVNTNVGIELQKIGLEVINVNIRDITDESGYIEAIGKRAAAEAIEQAKVDVAEQKKTGEIGQAEANKIREVQVAHHRSQSEQGQSDADKQRRIAVSQFEAEAVEGEVIAERDREIAVAQQKAESEKGAKEAEANKRIRIALLEAEAIEGENTSRAKVAESNSLLAQKVADAKRAADVARANAAKDILDAEKEEEVSKLRKEQLAQQEVEKLKVQVKASAEAERVRLIAKGEADAILAKFDAEAEGQQHLMNAKAAGYQSLVNACQANPAMVPTLLMIERLPELVAEQVKAIQNLKIDKITVWDGGANGKSNGTTAGFLSSMVGALPPMHELAEQAGIKLPDYLGRILAKDMAIAKETVSEEPVEASSIEIPGQK
ncbi:flotillin family protein [Planctomycetota bacterium]